MAKMDVRGSIGRNDSGKWQAFISLTFPDGVVLTKESKKDFPRPAQAQKDLQKMISELDKTGNVSGLKGVRGGEE